MAVTNSAITRGEFERMAARVTKLEVALAPGDAEPLAEPSIPEDVVARPASDDFVRQGKFRLFKWLGTFALATVFGGFALLYEQTSDVRVAMERLHAEVLREMHVLHESIREDMHAQHAAIRSEIAKVSERLVRIETLDTIESP